MTGMSSHSGNTRTCLRCLALLLAACGPEANRDGLWEGTDAAAAMDLTDAETRMKDASESADASLRSEDAARPADAGLLRADAGRPVDAALPGPDASTRVSPDASIPRPDASLQRPDASVVRPDASVVRPDASVPRPDASEILPDASEMEPDAGSSCDSPLPGYTAGNGSVTFYSLASGPVNCGFESNAATETVAHVATGGGRYFAALNTADYAAAATCGACVEITRDGTRKVVATVVDQCPTATNPGCTAGHIDLSEAAFAQLGDPNEGYLGTGNGGAVGVISWRYVPCPTLENVAVRLKEPGNAWWNQLLIVGHRHPIALVETRVGGAWVRAVRQDYNYWDIKSAVSPSAWPLSVRVTDVNGAQLELLAELNLSGDQAGSGQFASCP